MSLLPVLLIILALSGLIMPALAMAARLPMTEGHRTRNSWSRNPGGPRLHRSVLLNAALSGGFVLVVTHALFPLLLHDRPTAVWKMVLQAAAVLIIYDFLYYLTHRFLFHGRILYAVHSVHHRAKYPNALHSLYLHPLEMLIGLFLLMVSTYIAGPVHIYSFGIAFFIYSFLNIVIHAGLNLPFFPFRIAGYLARKHDKHHRNMQAGNFASITPVFDILFGTAE